MFRAKRRIEILPDTSVFEVQASVLLFDPQTGLEGDVHRQRSDVCHKGMDQSSSRQVSARPPDQRGAAEDPAGGESRAGSVQMPVGEFSPSRCYISSCSCPA